MNYFSEKERCCRCGCGMDIDPKLLKILNKAREIYGKPISLTSGARCLSHNEKIGASKTSSHTLGLATDIRTPDSGIRFELKAIFLSLGITRIGTNYKANFIHIDIDKDKAQNVDFGY